MELDRVTITGADDSVKVSDMVELNKKYPFVEWGILLSSSREGQPRYPSLEWMRSLEQVHRRWQMVLSGHLCGQWVRSLCRGNRRFESERSELVGMFQRVQINFHGDPHDVDGEKFVTALKKWDGGEVQFIFQFDDVNNAVMAKAVEAGVDVAPLFDTSGGAGIYPAEGWPAHFGDYCGYAGGLHPDKIGDQLMDIDAAVGPKKRAWVDVETHVRSEDDLRLDLNKVDAFLAKCKPWVQRWRE